MSKHLWIGFFLCIAGSSSLYSEEINYSVATISLPTLAAKGRFEKVVLWSEVEKAASSAESTQKAFSRIVLAALLDFKAEEFLFYPHVPKYRVDYVLDMIFMNRKDSSSWTSGDRVKIYEEMRKRGPCRFQITWKEKVPDYVIDPEMYDQQWPDVELSWIWLPRTPRAFEESVRQKLDRVYHSMVRKKVMERIVREKLESLIWQPGLPDMLEYYEKNGNHFPKELFRSRVLEITADQKDVDRILTLFGEREACYWGKYEKSEIKNSKLVQGLRRSFSADFLDQLRATADKNDQPLIEGHELDFTSQGSKPGLYLFSLSEETETTFIPFSEFIDNDGKYHLWILEEKGVSFTDAAVQRFIRNQLTYLKQREVLIQWIRGALRETVLRFSNRVLSDSGSALSSFQISDVQNQILSTLDYELEKIFEIDFICI